MKRIREKNYLNNKEDFFNIFSEDIVLNDNLIPLKEEDSEPIKTKKDSAFIISNDSKNKLNNINNKIISPFLLTYNLL